MENAEHSGKKARVELLDANVPVKQEAVEEAHGGGGGGGEAGTMIAVAAEGPARVEVAVRIDMDVLHCPICFVPLKPPVFQCVAGHLACEICQGKLPSHRCQACDQGQGGGVYDHNPALDTFIRSAKIYCPNKEYGCGRNLAYYEVGDHERVCPHAPCSCSEAGCGFLGLPPKLVDHLTAVHSWPVDRIPRYGTVHLLHLPASERRCLLVVQEDEHRAFLLSVRAHGASSAVSVVCLRACAASGPQYTCKLWTQAPPDPETGYKDTLMMETKVTSCARGPCEVAVEEGTVLSVPPVMLHGPSEEMLLRIRIDKLRPPNRSAA